SPASSFSSSAPRPRPALRASPSAAAGRARPRAGAPPPRRTPRRRACGSTPPTPRRGARRRTDGSRRSREILVRQGRARVITKPRPASSNRHARAFSRALSLAVRAEAGIVRDEPVERADQRGLHRDEIVVRRGDALAPYVRAAGLEDPREPLAALLAPAHRAH